jgi:VWFA-related protein
MFGPLLQRAPGALLAAVCASWLCSTPIRCPAQEKAEAGPAGFVLKTGTRLVVEDVLVMDAKGEPVHGLPKAAFHVFDENKPQTIRNFEEGSPAKQAEMRPPFLLPGVFSNNSYLYSSALVSDVFLIDADGLEIEDQMFLLQQLRRSIDALPPGVQAAVFCETHGRTVELLGLTAQHANLRSGVAECIPRLPTTGLDAFASGIQQLLTVAANLQPLPGRKNILWFSGPFPLLPINNGTGVRAGLSADYRAQIEAAHQMQNLLAEARISVFPLDPRGVTGEAMLAPGDEALDVGDLQDGYRSMQEFAEATGGTSSHLNDLEQQINRAVSLGQDSYTLSYSPSGYTTDNSWHAIRIAVDGPYRIFYRRGYLASSTGPGSAGPGSGSARLLTAGTSAHPIKLAATLAEKPLIFTVQLDPPATPSSGVASPSPPPAHRSDRVDISVHIPVQQLGFTQYGGKWQSFATVAAYAYDVFGELKGGERQELDSTLSEENWQAAQTSQVGTHQAFAIPRSAKYVLFVVTDKASRRQGTLMIPAQALRPNP